MRLGHRHYMVQKQVVCVFVCLLKHKWTKSSYFRFTDLFCRKKFNHSVMYENIYYLRILHLFHCAAQRNAATTWMYTFSPYVILFSPYSFITFFGVLLLKKLPSEYIHFQETSILHFGLFVLLFGRYLLCM